MSKRPRTDENIISEIIGNSNRIKKTFFSFININFLDLPSEIHEIILKNTKRTEIYILKFVCKQLNKYITIYCPGYIENISIYKLIEYPIKSGNIEFLKWIIDLSLNMSKKAQNFIKKPYICKLAGKNGYLDIIKLAINHGSSLDMETFSEAAHNGHLGIIKWGKNNNHLVSDGIFDKVLCARAALGNKLKVLKWITKNGFIPDSNTILMAVSRPDSLNMLNWLKENGYSWTENKDTFTKAATHGNIKIMSWLKDNGYPWNEYACSISARNGNLKALKWLRNNGCPWSEETCANAAFNGNIDILKWAKKNGCSWDIRVTQKAAKSGNLEMLKWAKKNGCPWDIKVASNAAKSGNLETLKWIIENGCPYDYQVTNNAAKIGNLEILGWAMQNGFNLNKWICAYAAENGHLEILEWAIKYKCPWDESVCAHAAKGRKLQVLEWLKKNKCPWNADVLHYAISNDDPDIFNWARYNGYDIDKMTSYYGQIISPVQTPKIFSLLFYERAYSHFQEY
jgi:hypothetical protein